MDPDHAKLSTAETALGLRLPDRRLLRIALTDPGWCNEVETPVWVDPWPGNRVLAVRGEVALANCGLEPLSVRARRAEALGLWDCLWLAEGQRSLKGAGRETVLARALTAVIGALALAKERGELTDDVDQQALIARLEAADRLT